MMDSDFADPAELARTLSTLRDRLLASKLQVIGGEPLLHPAIDTLLEIAAQSGVGESISVKTNGLGLHRMSETFWRHADRVIVSVYPATERYFADKRERLDELARAHGVQLDLRPILEFRHIRITSNASASVARHVYAKCDYKHFTHSLRDGRLYRCAPSVNGNANALGDSISPMDCDDEALRAYLTANEPLRACFSCLGSSGAPFLHRMAARQTC